MKKLNYSAAKLGNVEIKPLVISTSRANSLNHRDRALGRRKWIPGVYTALYIDGVLTMDDTPVEYRENFPVIQRAHNYGGVILLNGLGLGLALRGVLASPLVKKVAVVELNYSVIELVSFYFRDDDRVTFLHTDALKYEPRKMFDAVWHDIWPTLEAKNLWEMGYLTGRFSYFAEWQGCWGEKTVRRLAR